MRAQCTQHHADRERTQEPLNLACELVVVVASEDSRLEDDNLHENGAKLAKSCRDAIESAAEFCREGFCWDLVNVSGVSQWVRVLYTMRKRRKRPQTYDERQCVRTSAKQE